MNQILLKIKNNRLSLGALVIVLLIIFFQTQGFFALNRDGTHFFIKLLEKGSPVSYDRARRFALLINHAPTSIAMFFGITNIKILAFIFSLSYSGIAALPIIYNFIFKSKNPTPLTISWLFFCYSSLFSAFYLVSESIAATSVMVMMMSFLFKSSEERGTVEKVLFLVFCFLSSKLYPSVLFYIPLFLFLLIREAKGQKTRDYTGITAIILLLLSSVYIFYWLVNYPYQTIGDSSILNMAHVFTYFYYVCNHVMFFVVFLSLFIENKKNETFTVLSYSLMAILSIVWFIYAQDSTTAPWQHHRFRIINMFLPLIMGIILRNAKKEIFAPALIWILCISLFSQINFSRQNFKFLSYLERNCSEGKGLIEVNLPPEIKEFERDAFHLPGLSLLACAMNNKTVNALVVNKEKNSFQLFDPSNVTSYPHLERFGVDIKVDPRRHE
jgi:hypothetical protein